MTLPAHRHQVAPVRLRQRHHSVVHRHDEAPVGLGRQPVGQVRDDPGRLQADPVRAELAHELDEGDPPDGVDVRQRRAVHHDERHARGRLLGQPRQVVDQVARGDGRGLPGGNVQCRGQPLGTVDVLGPDQALQPAPGIRVADVDGREVEPVPPGDRGQGARQLHRPADQAGQLNRGVRRTELSAAFPEVGKTMLFLFDYGDEWRFKVELIGLGRKEPNAVYPRVLKRVGEAPPQYPGLEEVEEG